MARSDLDADKEAVGPDARRSRQWFWPISLFLCLYVLVAAAILAKPFDRFDYWVHLSVIRALAEGDSVAGIPLARNVQSIERLYDPYHAVLALIMRRTSLRWTDLLAAAGLFNVALLFSGLAYLGRAFARRWTMPFCLGVTILFLWGIGYTWSNEIYLSVLPRNGLYPATLAWGLSFHVMGLALNWKRRGGIHRLAVAAVLGALAITVHALTAVMFTLVFPVLWIWMGRTTWRNRLIVCLYPAAAVALSLLWPHNSLFRQLGMVSVAGIGGNAAATRFLVWPNLPLVLGPAWLGLVLAWWAPRSWRRPLVAGIGMYLAAWIGASLAGVRLSHRFVFFLGFAMQLAIVGAAERMLRIGLRRRKRHPRAFRAVLTGAAVLVIPWVPLHLWRLGMIYNDRVRFHRMELQPSIVERYESACLKLRSALPESAIVLVDTRDARIFAGFGLPVVPAGGLRQLEFSSLDPDFLDSLIVSARQSAATHFVIDHILLGREDLRPREAEHLARFGSVTRLCPEFTVLEFEQPSKLPIEN